MTKHEVKRVRQDVVKRTLHVVSKEQITPRMLRIVFHSEELAGFQSPSPDDHVKIFLPSGDGDRAIGRDFTPRAWNADAKTLTLDFALHPHGPAVDWAQRAEVGETLDIGGPRGSTVVPDDFDWYLLIGDATALPSIGRRMESLPAKAEVRVLTLLDGPNEQAYLPGATNGQVTSIFSGDSATQDADRVLRTLEPMDLPAGDGFIWIAAEAEVARTLYRYVVDTLRHPAEWVKAAGYWSRGKADGGERIA